LKKEARSKASEAERLVADLASLIRQHDEAQQLLAAERLRANQMAAEHAQAEAEAVSQRQRAERAEAERTQAEAGAAEQLQRAEQAKATGERLRLEGLEQQRSADAAYARLQLARDTEQWRADDATERLKEWQDKHNVLRGSLRIFLRGYLPLLRRHLMGQRP
jgi:hypothetical protein